MAFINPPTNYEFTSTSQSVSDPLAHLKNIDSITFVEIPILSVKITQNDIDEYERRFNEYEEALMQYNDEDPELNRLRKIEKPKPPRKPGNESVYTEVGFNFSDIVIKDYSVSYDDVMEREIIVMEYYPAIGGDVTTVNIGLTSKEWYTLLQRLGHFILSKSFYQD